MDFSIKDFIQYDAMIFYGWTGTKFMAINIYEVIMSDFVRLRCLFLKMIGFVLFKPISFVRSQETSRG